MWGLGFGLTGVVSPELSHATSPIAPSLGGAVSPGVAASLRV